MWNGSTRGAETPRSRFVSCTLLALAAGLLGACGETEGGIPREDVALEMTLEPTTPVVGSSKVTLVLKDADGEPVEGAEVRVEGNMNHAGMVPVFADASESSAGRYEAEIRFTMGGDWFLLVKATTADGRRFDWKQDVPGVRRD